MQRRDFLGLLCAGALTSCAHNVPFIGKADKAPFAVAAFSDLHVTDARSTAIVTRAVKEINANQDVKFVVAIGDLSSEARLTELNLAAKALEGLERPWLAVPGNHDVDPASPNPYSNYEKSFNLGNWLHEVDRWVFIGLDSCDGTASDVSVRPDRLEWLRKTLKHVGQTRPVGLFCHHPLAPGTKAYRVTNAQDVLGLFQGHNLKFVANGHFHGNQEEVVDGVLFTTTACCSSTRGNHDQTQEKGYRLFLLDDQSVRTQFLPVA